ncbi:MAG: hypothetical protein L3J92_05090 [Thermoplasmata archaeon]|nr:hypothetical protein [Thermoplasmata archaeon]
MDYYHSREVVLFTANPPPPLSPAELVRLLLVHWDDGARLERLGRADEFEKAAANTMGRRIGPALSRFIQSSYPTVRALMGRRKELTEEIRAAATALDLQWTDGRRPGALANVWIGLEAFGAACVAHGVLWAPPSIPDFVREVAAPLETASVEMQVTPLAAFRAWFSLFRNTNTVRKVQVDRHGGDAYETDSPKGEGTLFFTDAIDLNEDGPDDRRPLAPARIAGVWVREGIRDAYNAEQDKRSRPELRFGSLKELSETAAREGGLPGEAFLRFDKRHNLWKPQQPRFADGKNLSAAFIPDQEGRLEGILDNYLPHTAPHPPIPRLSEGNPTDSPRSTEVSVPTTSELSEVVSGCQRLSVVVGGCQQVVSRLSDQSTDDKTTPKNASDNLTTKTGGTPPGVQPSEEGRK